MAPHNNTVQKMVEAQEVEKEILSPLMTLRRAAYLDTFPQGPLASAPLGFFAIQSAVLLLMGSAIGGSCHGA
jgi:hypothetical protein